MATAPEQKGHEQELITLHMTLEEALAKSAMEGVYITHSFFYGGEYIEVLSNGDIRDEEGIRRTLIEWLSHHKSPDWKRGWWVYGNQG
jgi:hypothetical protein